jgi:hypothetical protein
VKRWWFADAPAERLAALRIAIGSYALVWLVARAPELAALAKLGAGHFAPTGIARLVDAPLPPAAVIAIALATIALLIAFTLGIAYRYTAPLAAAALLWTLTYRNAWGLPFHTENLLVLHVVALACAPAADAWTLDRTRARTRAPARDGYGWPIKLMAVLTVATYLLAGVAKLRLAGLDWLDGETLRNQIAIDNLRKALLGAPTAVVATPLLDHPASFTIVSALTLVLELGAPLALLGRRIAIAWALGAWTFHVGVVLMMNIWFPYPLFGFAYLPLFAIERVGPWLRRNSSPAVAG